jgi:RND family efflux transporter MFP subunit
MLRFQSAIAIAQAGHPVSFALLLSSLAVAACSKAVETAAPPAPVRVQQVSLTAAVQEDSFTGAVRARVEADLAFRVSGKVVERAVDVGQRVHAGDVIAKLDPQDYLLGEAAANNQRQAAAADAELAASDVKRFASLSARGFVSRAEAERYRLRADAAREHLEQAKREAELARNRVAYTVLRASFEGLVTALHIEAGQVVAEGQAVVTVAALGEREIVIDVPESRVLAVQRRRASATLWAADPRRFAVTLRELSPAASAATRTYRARYRVGPDAPQMELGMTATVWIANASPGDAPAVATLPASALHHQAGQPAVWTVSSAGAAPILVPVQVLQYGQEEVQVTGLHEGQLVVTAGVQKLDPGMRVVPVGADGDPIAAGLGDAITAPDAPSPVVAATWSPSPRR